jgi:hypothetical protein
MQTNALAHFGLAERSWTYFGCQNWVLVTLAMCTQNCSQEQH